MDKEQYNSNQCYQALVESHVSTTTKENVFTLMRDVGIKMGSHEQFLVFCSETEEQYKKDFHTSTLTNPYRSAKSVISTALKHNIELSNKGKTELQKEIKECKAVPEVVEFSDFAKQFDKLKFIIYKLPTYEIIAAKDRIKHDLGI